MRSAVWFPSADADADAVSRFMDVHLLAARRSQKETHNSAENNHGHLWINRVHAVSAPSLSPFVSCRFI